MFSKTIALINAARRKRTKDNIKWTATRTPVCLKHLRSEKHDKTPKKRAPRAHSAASNYGSTHFSLSALL
jgi:hypothetical protein